MRLSVTEAIASGRLNGTELVAGAAGLHNVVTGSTVLREWQSEPRVPPGHLVMLDLDAPGLDVFRLSALLAELAALSVAAVVIRDDLADRELKVQADHHQLPLLTASGEGWQRIIGSIQRDLLLTQVEIYERVQEIHNALTDAMVRGHGIIEIAGVLANLIHNPVVIENYRFEVLAWHNDGAQPDPVRQRVIEERRVPAHVLEVLGRHGVLQRIGVERKPFRVPPLGELQMKARVMAPIWVKDVRYGHISISESNHSLGELDLMAVEQAAMIVALQLSMEHAISEREERLAENLLHDVLFSRDQPESTIHQRLSFLGHALATRYAVMVIDADDFSTIIAQQRWDESAVQSIKDSLKRQTRVSLGSKGKSTLVASTGDALVVLYPLDEYDTLEMIRGCGRRLQKQMSDVSPHLSFSIGIGRICERIGSAVLSYQDAQSASSAGRVVRGKGSITLYDELGIYGLLAKCGDVTLLHGYVEKSLGQLIEHDARRRASLVKTLRAYLNNRGNLKQTASDLYVHLNTVKYRLRKISELTGADLNNADDVLNLHVGLKIADMDSLNSL